MARIRNGSRVLAAGLAALPLWLAASAAHAEGFVPVGGLSYNRTSAASVSLPNGSVLVASENSIERYDPAGRWFFLVAYMTANHGSGLTATLLSDGKVLIVGGQYGNSVANAEIYDPAVPSISPTGSLSEPRSFHTATLLSDGRVLVAGGHRWNHHSSALASAEIYDPTNGSFSPAGDMASARQDATATSLSDGRVLVAGGYGTDGAAQTSAELFDPTTGSFTSASDMGEARANHTATTLADGSVLIVGGHSFAPGPSLSSVEIYDPSLEAFSSAGDMAFPRGAHTATLLDDGRVFVAGGFTAFPFTGQTLASAEIWEPSTATFTQVAHGMLAARGRHVAAALADGEVLVAGGLGQYGSLVYSAEVYSPTYEDTEAPVIHVPQDITTAAGPYGPEGTYVSYGWVWATDNADPNPQVTCEPTSGSFFLVGTTHVTCSATDSWGNTGTASFRVTVLEPLAIAFTVDAFGSVNTKTGVASVGGTVACNRPASGWLSGQLTQTVASRATLVGNFSVYIQCGPEPASWGSSLAAQNGRFKSGKAVVAASASASDNYSYASAAAERTIQLRARN